MSRIDRTRHDSDVFERVLGMAQEEPPPSVEVIDLGVRPWLAGAVSSVVQMSIGDDTPRREDADPDRRRR